MNKRRWIKLVIALVLLFLAVPVVAVVTSPAIPREVTKMNARASDPLKDKVVAACSLNERMYKDGATLEASQFGYCPGFNVQSKIRWDTADSGHGITVVAGAKQTD